MFITTTKNTRKIVFSLLVLYFINHIYSMKIIKITSAALKIDASIMGTNFMKF